MRLTELSRHTAPGGRPQPITFLDGTLWLGAWDTQHLYAIDPATWTVAEEIALPGTPYGIAALDGTLRVVVSIGEADDRYIYTVAPGKALTDEGRIACPDFTGSHLTTDGSTLYLMQQTHGRLIELAPSGAARREIPFASRCAGIGFSGSTFHFIAADADFDVLTFATRDLARPHDAPHEIAPMDADARGLAYDGNAWWTAIREQNAVVSFR